MTEAKGLGSNRGKNIWNKVVAPLFNGAADIGRYSNVIVTLDLAPLQGRAACGRAVPGVEILGLSPHGPTGRRTMHRNVSLAPLACTSDWSFAECKNGIRFFGG